MVEGPPRFRRKVKVGGNTEAEVFCADEQTAVAVDLLRWQKLAGDVLAAQGVRGGTELSIFFVTSHDMAELNLEHMGKEGPTDPRAADRLYFKAALPVLLRLASVPIFVARCQGQFITWPGTPRWHYVALVRYRSRRDFFKFALAIERSGHDVYKWAAIEATHLMPVQALVSCFWVRTTLALVLALAALAAWV